MATPTPGSVSVAASTAAVYAGRYGPPAWMPAVGQWGAIPSSTWSTSGAPWPYPQGHALWPGGNSVRSVITAWCGGVLNTSGIWRSGAFVPGSFLVLFGGGHGDYAGNELYAFGPLEADAPSWSRITDPTLPAPRDVGRAGGYPVSRHTYDTLHYDPVGNRMYCLGAPGYYEQGFAIVQCDVFDFAVNPASGNPWSTLDTGLPPWGSGGGGTINLQGAVDTVAREVWGIGQGNGQRLGRLDCASQTWTSWVRDNGNGASNAKGAIAPQRRLFALWSSTGQILVQNLDSPTSALYTPTVTGSGPGVGGNVLEWDAEGGRFVAWSRTGATVYFLTPGANAAAGGDPWAWTSLTPGGATPPAGEANGTYGRWRMWTHPVARGVVLMPTWNQPVYFYRMA